jgi:hypothetical protein
MISRSVVLAAVLCSTAVGCGSQFTPVSGLILLDGKPIDKGAEVTFVPEGDMPMASGMTNDKGRFKLADVRQNGGLMPGSYKVIVSNVRNFVPMELAGTPDGKSGGSWDRYEQEFKRLQNEPPLPGMVPHLYRDVSTTPLHYTAPQDGREVRFDLTSNAAPAEPQQ